MDDKKVNLEEMGNTEIKLCEGLIMDAKPNIHTIRLMERRFGMSTKDFSKIDFTFVDNTITLIYLLALQHDKTITEEYVEDKIDEGGLDEVGKILSDVFKVNVKKKVSPKAK